MTHRAVLPRLQINARLVKEKDRARARELRRLLLYGAVIVVPLLVYVWQRVEFLRLSYQVEAFKKERQQLQERNKQLVVERSFLLSPDRIERLARKEIGLVDPSPTDVRRVAVVDGHIDEVGPQASAGAAPPPPGEPGVARATPAAAGGSARRPPRARRKPSRPPAPAPSQVTPVQAGVGILPAIGTAAPVDDEPEPAP